MVPPPDPQTKRESRCSSVVLLRGAPPWRSGDHPPCRAGAVAGRCCCRPMIRLTGDASEPVLLAGEAAVPMMLRGRSFCFASAAASRSCARADAAAGGSCRCVPVDYIAASQFHHAGHRHTPAPPQVDTTTHAARRHRHGRHHRKSTPPRRHRHAPAPSRVLKRGHRLVLADHSTCVPLHVTGRCPASTSKIRRRRPTAMVHGNGNRQWPTARRCSYIIHLS